MCHKNNKNNVVDTTLEEIKRRHICYIRRISDKTSNGLNIPCFTAIDPINLNSYLEMHCVGLDLVQSYLQISK